MRLQVKVRPLLPHFVCSLLNLIYLVSFRPFKSRASSHHVVSLIQPQNEFPLSTTLTSHRNFQFITTLVLFISSLYFLRASAASTGVYPATCTNVKPLPTLEARQIKLPKPLFGISELCYTVGKECSTNNDCFKLQHSKEERKCKPYPNAHFEKASGHGAICVKGTCRSQL